MEAVLRSAAVSCECPEPFVRWLEQVVCSAFKNPAGPLPHLAGIDGAQVWRGVGSSFQQICSWVPVLAKILCFHRNGTSPNGSWASFSFLRK